MRRTSSFLIVVAIAVAGCSAVGVVATSDPAAKLDQAAELFGRLDRPLPAERLIREAADIYEQRNDQLGLAEAYRTYGFFFRASSVERWAHIYNEKGFLDKTATYGSRFDKAIEYFVRAQGIFEQRGLSAELSNIRFNKGVTYQLKGDKKNACLEYDASLVARTEADRASPGRQVSLPSGYSTFGDLIADAKRRAECEKA